MRTLFSENILSPTPTPAPEQNKKNPFELSFASSGPSAHNSSTASSHNSPKENDWLTSYYREQQRFANEVHIQSNQSHASQNASTRSGHARRKGNPKVLFMGMRRSAKIHLMTNFTAHLTSLPEAANPPSKKSSSRNSPQPKPSTSTPPTKSNPPQCPPS